ncbi:MAG: zinc-dependent alcohol dehydrogenase, partial [Inquilinus sp.]|nr:zinc-dependent alcohol dehydrogenase [Inquilinus sp.]
ALVTASSNAAFAQGLRMLRKRGTAVLHGLPPGDFPVPIMEMVLQGKTVRGSIVGTRLDLIECLAFAVDGKVAATIETQPLEQVNAVLDRMRAGTIDGRVVLAL